MEYKKEECSVIRKMVMQFLHELGKIWHRVILNKFGMEEAGRFERKLEHVSVHPWSFILKLRTNFEKFLEFIIYFIIIITSF